MKVYYDKSRDRLIYTGESANPEFWERYWETENVKRAIERTRESRSCLGILKTIRRYLPDKNGMILEGGCGRGELVYLMQANGYKVVGVDIAANTIEQAKKVFPELDIRVGDVRDLEFRDSQFTAYWSGGVIEHFWDGYDAILAEMRRVLVSGGVVFLTFPYLSPLRRLKARLNLYKRFEAIGESNFYQFAFNHALIIEEFERKGFRLLEKKPLPGIYGLMNDIPVFASLIQRLHAYEGRSVLIRGFRYALGQMVVNFSPHTILLVFTNVK